MQRRTWGRLRVGPTSMTLVMLASMGYFFITAMRNGDYPQILPWLMITVFFVILFNLVADIVYALLDPRIRYR